MGVGRRRGKGGWSRDVLYEQKIKSKNKKKKRKINGLLSAFREDYSFFIGRLMRRTCHASPGSPPPPCHSGLVCWHTLMDVHEACTTDHCEATGGRPAGGSAAHRFPSMGRWMQLPLPVRRSVPSPLTPLLVRLMTCCWE